MMNYEGWVPALLSAAGMTVYVAVLASIFGIALGMTLASLRLTRWRILHVVIDGFTTSIRAIPQLLLILLIYFGSTTVLNAIGQSLGVTRFISVPPLPAGVLALAIVFGAYATEVFRGAYLAVPKGMLEAGSACGMTSRTVFWIIKAPQMMRFALPGLANIWVSILKDTSLISVVGLEEIMRVSELATTTTQKPLLFYLTAGLIYFILTSVSDVGLDRLEQWSRRGEGAN